jgi:hypothetical protein
MSRCTTALIVVSWALGGTSSSLAQEGLDLPDGVIHIALPPGEVKWEYTIKKAKPFLRLSAGKAVIEAQCVFYGDGKAATRFEATNEGIHWPSSKGKKGFVLDGTMIEEPGSIISVQEGNYFTVDQLKPGSLYVTTPSITFRFGRAATGKSAEGTKREPGKRR